MTTRNDKRRKIMKSKTGSVVAAADVANVHKITATEGRQVRWNIFVDHRGVASLELNCGFANRVV